MADTPTNFSQWELTPEVTVTQLGEFHTKWVLQPAAPKLAAPKQRRNKFSGMKK